MITLRALVNRNIKLFFKDRGMFFTALITPLILLVLYGTFLGDVYRTSFVNSLPEGFALSESILNGLVGGQLISSILSVSCITVAFCSNFLMVQDKARGTVKDLRISPVHTYVLSLSYYIATLVSTLIICMAAAIASLIYVACTGWYFSVADISLLFLDIVLLVLFGTALSSVVNFFLSTQGQISAVGSIVSSCYGFISGAYMPISTFSESLQNAIAFLPGTYGTSLVRTHSTAGVMREMVDIGIPTEVVESIKDSIDCNIYFFDNKVQLGVAYLIISISISILVVAYVLINKFKNKDK